jgi:hypothetical protein
LTHAITTGLAQVGTFTGSAFQSDGLSILVFNSESISLEPTEAWVFAANTPRKSVAGWQQGMVKQLGNGRVAVFGEAAMFSEQNCARETAMGMNHPLARDNRQLVLNILRWLSGRMN